MNFHLMLRSIANAPVIKTITQWPEHGHWNFTMCSPVCCISPFRNLPRFFCSRGSAMQASRDNLAPINPCRHFTLSDAYVGARIVFGYFEKIRKNISGPCLKQQARICG